MAKKRLNRRQILGGVAAAAGSGSLIGALIPAAAAAADASTLPDQGLSQAPPIRNVRDKVAYITGGSSGIGLGIARALHERGAKVILGNYNSDQFADALKMFPAQDPRVATVVHDVMVRENWERKADEIEKIFGKVHILVNNAGVGVMSRVVEGTYKDWDWAMGVNFWGPVYGVRTFVPRMLAHKEGSHIVTTSSTDGLVLGTAGIYAVTKMAVTGLMEQMRHDLRTTNIGTSNLVPGFTTTNIAQSENYRPQSLRNDANAPRPPPPPRSAPGQQGAGSGMWARPQDPLTVGRFVVNGIVHNDMWICPAPEYQPGVEARGLAMAESMVPFTPIPASVTANKNLHRTPIYVQEVAHRRATRKRNIQGI
jgi:NAD(P)-dependent dehydrogenase (short-subunit alcohol dehydrogenase family)